MERDGYKVEQEQAPKHPHLAPQDTEEDDRENGDGQLDVIPVSSKESREAKVSLNSSGLTPSPASTAVSPASGIWLRRVLLAIAAFETLLGVN